MPLSDLFAAHDAEDAATAEKLAAALEDARLTDAELLAEQARSTTLTTQLVDLTTEMADLQATVTQLQALIDKLENSPAPAPPATVFGADATGTTLAAQTATVSRWGKGLAVRQFFTHFTEVAPRSPDVAVLHSSHKPGGKTPASTAAVLQAITPAAVRGALVNHRPNDKAEAWHEGDKKVRDGILASVADVITIKNRFFDVSKEVRPELLVVNTITAWEADPKNTATKGNIDKWGAVKADLLGIDCDGIHPTALPYPNFDDEIRAAQAFVAAHPGYIGWCVPEFGAPRVASDVDGKARAAWASECAAKFLAAGAAYVCLYERESTVGNAFTTPAEVDAWSALI